MALEPHIGVYRACAEKSTRMFGENVWGEEGKIAVYTYKE
jgi:hypothetical protein